MKNVFEPLFKYGFHDTELSFICGQNLEISLFFQKGLYLLDKTGKETFLSKPIQIELKLESYCQHFENAIEVKEYGGKIKFLNYSQMKKYLEKGNFEIFMAYYSNFNNCIMFEGSISKKNIQLSIEGINEIVIQKLKKV